MTKQQKCQGPSFLEKWGLEVLKGVAKEDSELFDCIPNPRCTPNEGYYKKEGYGCLEEGHDPEKRTTAGALLSVLTKDYSPKAAGSTAMMLIPNKYLHSSQISMYIFTDKMLFGIGGAYLVQMANCYIWAVADQIFPMYVPCHQALLEMVVHLKHITLIVVAYGFFQPGQHDRVQ